MTKQLSLIILTYNSEKDIYDCLRSVYQYNDIGDKLEIIVVDNNSAGFEAIRKNLQTQYPDVIVIKNEKNGGYGQGNNIGIKASSAPIIAIMNPDVRLIMPVFSTFLQVLASDNVIMCGGKQFASEYQKNASFYPDFISTPIRQSIVYRIRHHFEQYDYQNMWLQGAFFAIKKDCFENIGLFDENIFMYAEEFDIHIRLRKTFPNKKMVYLPAAKYLHLTAERAFSKENEFRQYQSDIYVCRKHGYSVSKMLHRMLSAARINYFFSVCRSPIDTIKKSNLKDTTAILTDLLHKYSPKE